MGIKTAIEYADSTVNPVMGCTGCELLKDHCYARRLCNRYAGLKGWPKDFTVPEHFPGRLEKALKWKDLTGTKRPGKPWLDGMPRVVFVNDLSDGFCPGEMWASEWLFFLLRQMEASPHIWLLLTKWPDRMRHYFEGHKVTDNFWLGTTLLRQDDTWRLDELLTIQGGKKWVSAEPLLGALDLSKQPVLPAGYRGQMLIDYSHLRSLDFVATGGETGPGARPAHPDNFRSLRNQCGAAKVSYFHKSNGAFIHASQMIPGVHYTEGEPVPTGDTFVKCSKFGSGDLLDGRRWRQMPNVPPRNK